MAHSARIRNIFDLHIPLSGPSNLESAPLLGTNFGFALAERNNSENCLQYHIQIVYRQPLTNEDISLPNSFVWAKRNAIRFQRSEVTQEIEGIIVRIKLPPKVFDFRKYKAQQTRIKVNEIQNGRITKQAFSNEIQILPKNRKGAADVTTFIPVFWVQELVPTTPISEVSPNISGYVAESPVENQTSQHLENDVSQADYYDEDIDEDMVQEYSDTNIVRSYDVQPNAIELQYFNENNHNVEPQYLTRNNNGVQYMVLYNGNAEVMGNFRALNFYKSSDINLKEDIRLLVENKDCRDTLLQIDGVNYKFKKGVHPDTNRRFVGYIAQQVESVVPEAVQLIDGILHVDYESLIPYLSESVRANYSDINDLRTKTDRIQRTIDELYEQFLRKESDLRHEPTTPYKATNHQRGSQPKKIVLLSVISVTVLIVLFTALAIAGFTPLFAAPQNNTIIANDTIKVPLEFVTVLKEFYSATNGDTWLRNDHWLNEQVSICDWYGMHCVEIWEYQDELPNGTVPGVKMTGIRMDLNENNLTGTLPSSLFKITWLIRLELARNALTGTVPEQYETFERLESLNIEGNSFNGTLPNIQKYPKLRVANLSNNKFSGTIPEKFLRGEFITEVYAANNQLEGPLPGSTYIQKLDLSSNRLTEPVQSLGMFLKHLNLANNQINSDAWQVATHQLEYLDLSNNKFFGSLHILPNTLENIMVHINVSNNQFDSWHDDLFQLPRRLVSCDASNNAFNCKFISSWIYRKCNATCE